MPNIIKRPKRNGPAARRGSSVDNVRTLREKYGLPQALLARLLDLSLRTISSLESTEPRPQFHRSLAQTSRLCQALAEVMDAGYVARWLTQPNEMLADLKPIEAIERGHIDLVWQVVDGLRSGSGL